MTHQYDQPESSAEPEPESSAEPENGKEGGTEAPVEPDPAPSDEEHPDEPWWWDLGPTSSLVIILGGVGLILWRAYELPWPFGPDDEPHMYYQAAKVIAIGLVMGGTSVVARTRARRRARGDEAPDGDERD